MKTPANLEASKISSVSAAKSVAIVGEVKERVTLVMDEEDRALYDFSNAPGVTDTGHELTDDEYRAVLDGKAYVKHGVVRYFRPKKTFHGVSVEAERERIRNAKKLAEIADALAIENIAINVPGRSIPTQSEIEVVWLS